MSATAYINDTNTNRRARRLVLGRFVVILLFMAALLLPAKGRWKERHQQEKDRLLRMDLATFRQALIQVPAQIVRTSRRIVYRLLAWNPWQHVFFRLLDQLRLPLRC